MSFNATTRKNYPLNQSVSLDIFSSPNKEPPQEEKLDQAKNKVLASIYLIHSLLTNNPSLCTDEKSRYCKLERELMKSYLKKMI